MAESKSNADNHAVLDYSYLQAGAKPLTTESSILISSSRFLNDPVLRDLHAQTAFSKNGTDLPVTYLSIEFYKAYLKVRPYEEEAAAIAAYKAADPKFAAWLDERFLSNYKAEAVAHCKPGTLGHMIHEFLVKSGMSMDFLYNGQEIESDLLFYDTRGNQSHDIEHMVMGFDVNFGGEVALDMFRLAQDSRFLPENVALIRNRPMGYAMSTAMMKTALHYPKMMYQFMECSRIGVEAANRINRNIIFVKWEDFYDVSLAEVRQELNIVPPEPHAWDWTDEAYGLPPLPPHDAKAAD